MIEMQTISIVQMNNNRCEHSLLEMEKAGMFIRKQG